MPYKDKNLASKKRRDYELKNPFVSIIKNIKRRIDKSQKNIAFSLTKRWAKQNSEFCALTKLKFKHANNRVTGPYSPSVDRKIPELGYVEENCRKILMGLNGLKHTGTDEEMYIIAEALLKNRKRK